MKSISVLGLAIGLPFGAIFAKLVFGLDLTNEQWSDRLHTFWLMVALAVVGHSIEKHLKGIQDALAKGKATEGSREQGREASRSTREPYVLAGHWHKGR